jgi:tRNA/tmRNA/rRNA uracil-C5-methylase (TrmA/RlmC/RlmD family)
VEAVGESAALAAQNAAVAGITNVRTHAQDVLAFLREQADGNYNAVVVDPPRTGMGPAVCTELLRMRPQRLIYISCNPLTQIEDLRHLEVGYRLTSFQSYDMFPHTPHLETLALLDRV